MKRVITPESIASIKDAQKEAIEILDEVEQECDRVGWKDLRDRARRVKAYATVQVFL